MASSPELTTLVGWLEAGDPLSRAHAVALLVRRGEEAVPELSRLASKAPTAVRREALAALGRIGGEAALEALMARLGDGDCRRALLEAIAPHGEVAIPLLARALAPGGEKKGQERRRRIAGALLYRLGAWSILTAFAGDEDPGVRGFALAAVVRAGGRWGEAARAAGEPRTFHNLAPGLAAMAQAEVSGDPGPLIDLLAGMAVNEAREVAEGLAGSPVEHAVGEHYLSGLSAATAKERQRAANVLRGLALPALVPRVAATLAAGEASAEHVAQILAETGGGHALGVLLDLAAGPEQLAAAEAFKGLKELGDPGSVPALLEMLAVPSSAGSAEFVLVSLGDSAVDLLAVEMRAREGRPLAARIQQVLLQIGSRRAKEALEGTDLDSLESLVARLGHPALGAEAAKALARRGEAALEALDRVVGGSEALASYNAMNALGSIKGERAYQIVSRVAGEAAARSAGASRCHTRALELLAVFDDPRSMPLLVRALASGNHGVTQSAATALLKIGRAAVPGVVPLLEDPRPHARSAALALLGEMAAVEAEPKGIELLCDADEGVRVAAARALGPLGAATGNPAVVEALGACLDRETGNSYGVLPTIEALVRIGRREAIPHLRRFAGKAGSTVAGGYLRDRAEAAARKIEATAPKRAREGVAGKLRQWLGGR